MTAIHRTALVRLEGCSRAYRRGAEVVHALRDVSIDLHPGELVAVAGPSGSGKTTLLNLLIGWERPDQGAVRWSPPPDRRGPPPWRRLGVVPQRLGLIEELTLGENVRLPLTLGDPGGVEDPAHADALTSALRIGDLGDRLPAQTSLGEQQRAAIARALVIAPDVAVLDEPTAHQDETSAAAVAAVLRRAADAGTGCLVATHAPDLLAVVDRVVRLADGRVVG